MTFPILGGNSAVGGYAIDNSLRFNSADQPSLTKTFGSAGNRKTFTLSCWVKRGKLDSTEDHILSAGSSNDDSIFFNSSHYFRYIFNVGGTEYQLLSNQVFRDVSAWYHLVVITDTTQSTATDRIKVYVNGNQITSFQTDNRSSLSQNHDMEFTNSVAHCIGDREQFRPNTGNCFDGYLAETHFIDGQALSPTDFGEFDEDSGIWKPIRYSGSYGTNGFYLDFENSGSLGADQSGNGNNFTPTNLASTDQTTDTPTNNFATWNVLMNNNPAITTGDTTFIEGNTEAQFNSSSQNGNIVGTIGGLNTGKFYWENKVVAVGGDFGVGIANEEINYNTSSSWNSGNSVLYLSNGNKRQGGTNSSYGASYTTGDIIGVALDLDANTITFYKNGSSQGSISVVSGYRYNVVAYGYNSAKCSVNFGNPSYSISSGNSDGNGYGNFEYAPPSGYLALCTQNLATALSPTIDDGSVYFQATTYTGDGNDDRQVTNSGNSDLQPDLIWVKNRTQSYNHIVQDTSRGLTTGGYLTTNGTQAESGATTTLVKTATTDGFTVGTSGAVNWSGDNLVAWQWKANAGSTSSNTDGDETTTVQASTTSGFSIITYQPASTLSDQTTIGHGLGSSPDFLIYKNRDTASHWIVYPMGISGQTDQAGFLSLSDAFVDANILGQGYFDNPTSTTIRFRTGGSGSSSGGTTNRHLLYAFKSIEGYSKFGSYTGNGNADGPFAYTGFRPSFILVKGVDGAHDWHIFDSTRDTFNVMNHRLQANTSGAEDYPSGYNMDSLSNGFKITHFSYALNTSGQRYIYMAFAENPFVSSTGIPVTAR